jgi:HD superfamily phosphohydrolase YqeK
MLENIVAHSIQVCRVGMCLVDHLKFQGIQMKGQLVQAAALLHDITKSRSYSEQKNLAEAEIINYADKRVLHDRIVSLDERMSYIQERYGTRPEHKRRIRLLWDKTKVLEKQIFAYLPFSPNNLNHHLTSLDISSEISSYQKVCSQL